MPKKSVRGVMKEFKAGTLHSGKGGPVVRNRKQAIAIALSATGKSKTLEYDHTKPVPKPTKQPFKKGTKYKVIKLNKKG